MRLAKLRKLGRPISPSDLRNPKRKSGYDYVGVAHSFGGNVGANGPVPLWRGEIRFATGDRWRGPIRRDPAPAAQDFCDWVNGAAVAVPATLVTAGHEYEADSTDPDPEYQAALGVIRDRRAQRAGKQGFVYLIVEEVKLRRGCVVRPMLGKVGFSTNPQKRVAELQTGNARLLRLVGSIPGTEADERKMHMKYLKDNVMQEWFRLTDALLAEFEVSDSVRDI